MKSISFELVRVTESAAIGASKWIGGGDKLSADKAATEAMQHRLFSIKDFYGIVKIGEGKKDQSYGLFKNDKVGNWSESILDFGIQHRIYDIAVDPIDGTTPTVNSGPEAMSVLAISNHNTMFDTEEDYMLKLAVGPKVLEKVRDTAYEPNLKLLNCLPNLCKIVAGALDKSVDKLMVCILNRPRHEKYIEQMRALGVRIKLIQDCDISGAIATCLPENGIDMQFGVGGAPEAVITAAAMKCLGGYFMAQIWKSGELIGPEMGIEDLVRGECAFAATGITNGSLLRGVRYDSRGPITNSVFMRSESKTIRWLTTSHGN